MSEQPGDAGVTREDESGGGAGGDHRDLGQRTRIDPPGFSAADPTARTRSDDTASDDSGQRDEDAPRLDRLPPALADRFSFVRPLGSQGAQGRVALYQDAERRFVVIKLYPAAPATPAVWRLWQEAQEVTEQVVRLVDCLVEDGYAYEVTEYVPGGSLVDRDQRTWPLAPDAVESVVRQLTSALRIIHTGLSQRLVHRDLAPGNVLVRFANPNDPIEVCITDFGVAVPQRETFIARVGVAGTPAYAAPEAAYGQSSPARDWWSLVRQPHLVMFEALSLVVASFCACLVGSSPV
jgi:serine/threonine protein kinase